MAIYFPNSNIQEINGKINIPGSTIVQVVETRSSATLAVNNWSTQNELFQASITPTQATNKILVYMYGAFRQDSAPTNWSLGYFWIWNITTNTNIIVSGWNGSTRMTIQSYEKCYLDSPNSTATQTYSFRVGNYPTGTEYYGNNPGNSNASDGYSYLRLTEITA